MIFKLGYFVIPVVVFWFAGCTPNSNSDIPKTEKQTVTDHYYGTKVDDPYRWLEDRNSEKVKKWIIEQNEYTDKVLSGFAEGKPLTDRIKALSITSVKQYSPELINGKLFFMQFAPPQPQPVIAFRNWPDGEVQILFDPNKVDENAAVTDFWPSPKGNYLAYGVAVGGNEATTIHIINVKDGSSLTDILPNAGGGATPAGLVWDANEKGFTYVCLPEPGSVPDEDLQFNAVLYHHTIGKSASDDKLVFGKDLSKIAEYFFIPSDKVTHAAMFIHYGDGSPDYVYFRIGDQWKRVLDTKANIHLTSESNPCAAWAGDNLLVISYQDAPKGKLLSITQDGVSKMLVPEGDWAMNAVSAIKGGFLITKVFGPDWRIDQYNNKGELIRTVDLPKTGIGIGSVASSGESDQALITYMGWKSPEKWVQFDAKKGELKTFFEVKPAADYSKIQVSRIDAVSKDGTKIPVTVLAKEGITPSGKCPTIVYGYGGFGIPTDPFFIGSSLAWIEKGGVLAYAHIRGGGEFGEGWHEAGMLGKKQNVFDDMYAAAESMVKNNWTDSEHLGILGGSNGGLLMGAELTQHPEAFKAVVSFVGIYDMLRNELFPNGLYNTSEYGTSTKESDFNWLYAYSPYHHIRPNTAYPAILLETAVNDPRVAAWQSRKFTAALQEANISGNSILLLTRMNEGHGVTSTFSQRVGNTAAALTFFAHELGLKME